MQCGSWERLWWVLAVPLPSDIEGGAEDVGDVVDDDDMDD